MKIYGIQYTGGGIPDDPEVFLTKAAARARWRAIAAERFDLDELPPLDLMGKEVTNPDEVTFFMDEEGTSEWRFWEVECAG